MLTKEQKKEIIQTYGSAETDTGSAEVQIALLSARITYLTKHFKVKPKDHASRRGLLKLVGQRRKFLKYLASKDESRYQNIIAKLGIRR